MAVNKGVEEQNFNAPRFVQIHVGRLGDRIITIEDAIFVLLFVAIEVVFQGRVGFAIDGVGIAIVFPDVAISGFDFDLGFACGSLKGGLENDNIFNLLFEFVIIH